MIGGMPLGDSNDVISDIVRTRKKMKKKRRIIHDDDKDDNDDDVNSA
jgi:hypothetical protein